MKTILIKVSPNSKSLLFYKVQYKIDLWFLSFFIPWKTIVSVYDGINLSYDQPILFEKFQDAEKWAKELKEDPTLIKKHYQNQDKIFIQAKERRAKLYEDRNITKIF